MVEKKLETLRQLAKKLRGDASECGTYYTFRKNELEKQAAAIDWAVAKLEKMAKNEASKIGSASSIFDEQEWRDKL